MDSPFIYTRPIGNEPFLGRQNELDWLSSNLAQGIHTMLIEPPRSGKRSLVNQALAQIQKQSTPVKFCKIELFNIRTTPEFFNYLAERMIQCFANTLDDWKSMCADFLPLNAPVVKVREGRMNDLYFEFSGSESDRKKSDESKSDEQIQEILELPEQLCIRFQARIVIYIEDFQNIIFFLETKKSLPKLLKTWKSHYLATYLLTAAKVNALKEASLCKDLSKSAFQHIPLGPIDQKSFTDYILKGFAKAGRVISKELAELLYRKTEGQPFYTQHLANICFIHTKGFMNEAMFHSAWQELLDSHHLEFKLITDDLSLPQINFLRAVLNDIERFCSSEVLREYQLNSSANVARVREALEKKEILEFVRNKPRFLNPLFKIWFAERFIQQA